MLRLNRPVRCFPGTNHENERPFHRGGAIRSSRSHDVPSPPTIGSFGFASLVEIVAGNGVHHFVKTVYVTVRDSSGLRSSMYRIVFASSLVKDSLVFSIDQS